MLANQKVLLTGANSGIGFEVLKLLAREKSNTIFAVDLNLYNLTGFAGNVIPYRCDVSSKEGVDGFFDAAVSAMGEITFFFANAGYSYYEVIDYVDWDRTRRLFETNVFSPIYSYAKYREYLNGRKGLFAVTISAMGTMAMPGYSLYTASKFALNGFQQAIRFEKPDDMSITCFYPIATDTNFFKAANPDAFEKPFPVQSPAVVAKRMLRGVEKGKKRVFPSRLFSLSMVLFAVFPFLRTLYRKMEKEKLRRFITSKKDEKENKATTR